MKFTKEQIVDKAVFVVSKLNNVFMGLILNGTVSLPKGCDNAIKDCFLARAKDLIMDATREQLEKAYDECVNSNIVELLDDYFSVNELIGRMFKVIGNKAPNPDNEKPIETVDIRLV